MEEDVVMSVVVAVLAEAVVATSFASLRVQINHTFAVVVPLWSDGAAVVRYGDHMLPLNIKTLSPPKLLPLMHKARYPL